jgi:hypothetical protein
LCLNYRLFFFLQFAGGFDPETMDAFEELRNLVHVRNSTL